MNINNTGDGIIPGQDAQMTLMNTARRVQKETTSDLLDKTIEIYKTKNRVIDRLA